MIPEKSYYTCAISWQGNNEDYESFSRIHEIRFPKGQSVELGSALDSQKQDQTNPEELFAAAVGSCMMQTILAVFSRSKIVVTSYEDHPEALLELVERRYKVTRVTLRPKMAIQGESVDREKLDNLMQKAHANCFIGLSVKSDVVIEPEFVFVEHVKSDL
jgi:organic hydroperoxide reductase OsmC/OhrA